MIYSNRDKDRTSDKLKHSSSCFIVLEIMVCFVLLSRITFLFAEHFRQSLGNTETKVAPQSRMVPHEVKLELFVLLLEPT